MFNLTEIIEHFNQTHQKQIRLTKTWGLVYLQPQSLSFLNKCRQLIKESVYYASPFITQHRALRAALAKTQDLPASQALPRLKTIVQQLKTDELIRQRLDWEEHLQTLFNTETFWKQRFSQVGNNAGAKYQLKRLYQDWKQHQPFQYYSSQGLLFLLDVVVKYHYHFTQAHQELERKQQAWLASQRLPEPIAESYRHFLESQLNYLKALQNQVIEALLRRLKMAEQQNQVTCDDVSYLLVEQSQPLNLSLSLTLPKHQRTLDATTFNQIHRAIEKYGNPHHKNQLYRLAWYQYGEFSAAKDITLITISARRLLVPTKLIHLMPKKVRKPAWLFRDNKARFAFLEKQQALLAQLVLPLDFTPLSPNSLSTLHLTLKPFILRYQLLQTSLQSLEKQPTISWWPWRQKQWKRAWYKWLMQHFRKNQEAIREILNHFFYSMQNHNNELSQVIHYQSLQDSLVSIQHLIEQGPHSCTRLTFLLKQLLADLHTQTKKMTRDSNHTLSLIQNFKHDISIALDTYVKYCQEQRRAIPEARMADIDYLCQLLNTTYDFLPLRKGVMQRYQTMQRPPLAKLITSFDGSVLRLNLRAVLDNPNYSLNQVINQKNSLSDSALKDKEGTVDRQATFSGISDTTNTVLLTLEQQLAQIQTHIQVLINNRDNASSSTKPHDSVQSPSRFFKRS